MGSPQFSISLVVYGLTLVAANVFALSMLPRTNGFTAVSPTAACILGFVITGWALSRLIYSGIELSILIPLAAAVIPLGTVAVGFFLYGESATLQKTILLVSACCLIGFAAKS